MTTPTFNVGDIVRRKKSSRNNEAYLVGTQPFEVKALEPGFVIDGHGKRHARFNLKLVEPAKPSPAVELSEYDRKLLEGIKQVATLGEQLGIKQANGRESANWTGAPQHPESVRDRHIQHIHDLDAVIRRRNKTIERQKAQLTEYAGEIERLKSKTHVMVRVEGVEDLIDDLKLMQEASEALAPRSIQLTIRISDADGKVAKYGAILGDVDEDSALDSAFAARDIVENTIDQHFNGKPKVAELLNGDAS